jgi:hypothetical protein
MSDHEWIKIEITPVGVIANGALPPVVFIDPDAQTAAAECAQYGCARCDIVLDEDTVESLCPGREYEEPLGLIILDEAPDADL